MKGYVNIKELDVVRLKDGREGTVLEVYTDPVAFLIETDEDISLWPNVGQDEIAEITYHSK